MCGHKKDRWSPIVRKYCPVKCASIDGTCPIPHDKAVLRALKARHVPNKRSLGDPSHTVFVGRLDPKTNEDSIRETMKQFGRIINLRLVRDLVTGFSKCYAFVEYSRRHYAQRAISKSVLLDGKNVFVDVEHGRSLPNWVPRRLGGGFGGRKESGQLRFGCLTRPFRRPTKHIIHKF
ncbi:U11/U12 small nuclear ribonucleoprotein 35 kDa protein-like [Octopus sinensis]|uniref:U11/U12 small nuclear ribonucleoprotein 35 kDa protein n=1 Tax=Octopus sinensis TaxID=2607531 RepID=A0A7E6EH97_9MOLL|nr:U11/U12 small nuclear ribonucleoprotein 35 kDa protein-like [Octopus sinensis]